MTPGEKTRLSKEGLPVVWKVPFYSEMKKVYAKNEDDALDIIREKLKSKWIGFRMFPKHNERV